MAPLSKRRKINQKQVKKLIEAVKARECLWNRNVRGHVNRFKTEKLWEEVATEMGTTSEVCRQKWKNIKDLCRKEMKKNEHNDYQSDWMHFNKLKFLHSQFLVDTDNDDNTNDSETTQKGEKRRKMQEIKRRDLNIDVNRLIELVKPKEVIWNRLYNRGFQSRRKIFNAWKEVADELGTGVTAVDVRLKWKYFRDQARKEVKKENSEWAYLPKIQFMVEQFELDDEDMIEENTENPLENGHCSNDVDNQGFDKDSDNDTTNSEPSAIPCTKATYSDEFEEIDTKPIFLDEDIFKNDVVQAQPINDVGPVTEYGVGDLDRISKDEDIGFFNSLLPHVRKLPPAKKLRFRIEIQELLFKTLYN